MKTSSFRKYFFLLSCLAASLLFASAIYAEVFKYIDKSGKVHYSDHPFTYLQKNFSQGDENAAFKANENHVDAQLLTGLWDLNAHSRYIGSDRTQDEGKWQFKANGDITIQRDKTITTTQYRVQGKLVEINLSNSWQPFRIASLNNTDLILRDESGDKILYFSKNTVIKEVIRVNKALYRRDQVKQLILYFACAEIKYESLTDKEKAELQTDIFRSTGIEHFDVNVFLVSVDHYKKDQIFIEKYQPQINHEIESCQRTNVVPRFDVE